MSSTDPLIHLADVKKVFYTDEVETHALSGIHLDLQKGEYLSIAGPSGCGKSTLLSILGLLDTPTDGEYVLNGNAVENLSLSQRARIRNREVGFIFQSFNLIGDLTVYENVELPLTYRGMNSGERNGSPKRSNALAWPIARSIFPVNFPVVSSSASRLPARSAASQAFCMRTNQRAIWILPTAKR